MHGQQNGVCIFRSLTWRAGACIALSVTRQPLELSLLRENGSELSAHQPRTQDANSHTALPRLSFLFCWLSGPPVFAALRDTEHLAPGSLKRRCRSGGDRRA